MSRSSKSPNSGPGSGRPVSGSDADRELLPAQPELALFIAGLFERLGGNFEIDGEGRRHAWRPGRERLRRDGLPQLEGAAPHERFRNLDEWEGAMKLAQYWLARLGDADRNLVYTLLAPLPETETESFDFRERLSPNT